MAKQALDLGTVANDNTGDTLRAGGDKINDNFNELYTALGNGTTYLPDPAGHLLIFINGILQPPGATNAYTAFSNQIQFTEAPDLGLSLIHI